MFVWVDDIRPAPEGWYWAKTYDEAIEYLGKYNIEGISLDHDMADEDYSSFIEGSHDYDEQTGYEIALFMRENNIWPEFVGVHSANPVGRKRIKTIFEDSEKYTHKPGVKIGRYGWIDGYVRKKEES